MYKHIDTIIEKYKIIPDNIDKEILKTCFSCIDLTSLNHTDNTKNISEMVNKVNNLSTNFPGMPNVAAICVYPAMVSEVKALLKTENVKIASVAGGFPSSQTFIGIKIAECLEAINAGADELDIVISVGEFISGNYDKVADEIYKIKKEIGTVHLKVILETGTLNSPELIYKASCIAMDSGADFIKTSTGKTLPAATPEAFYTMAVAARDFYNKQGRRIGLKAAGGIVSAKEAFVYFNIVKNELGCEYLVPEYFRIGASRLANNLLSEIEVKPVNIF